MSDKKIIGYRARERNSRSKSVMSPSVMKVQVDNIGEHTFSVNGRVYPRSTNYFFMAKTLEEAVLWVEKRLLNSAGHKIIEANRLFERIEELRQMNEDSVKTAYHIYQ